MNSIKPIFHQLEVANRTILAMMEEMESGDLEITLGKNKRTVRDLLVHLSVIYKADYLIMNEATQEEMEQFYAEHTPKTPHEIRESLHLHFKYLRDKVSVYTEEEWSVVMTSWWGVSYSRYEWMLEILGHIYHHRAQLHTVLVLNGRDVTVPLFE